MIGPRSSSPPSRKAARAWRSLGVIAVSVTIFTATIVGCFDDDYPVEPTAVEGEFALADLPEDSIRDVPEMVAIARENPSFGGMYFDDQGQLVVAMTDITQRAQLEPRIRQRLGSHETRAGRKDRFTVQVVTRPVEYSFLELARWKTSLRRAFQIDGVATLDANERINRVEIGVIDLSVESQVRQLVQDFGIPQNAVLVGLADYARQASDTIRGETSDVYGQTVIEAGWRVATPLPGIEEHLCTIGASAIRGSNGDSVFITNSHCSEELWEYDGGTAWHPHRNWTSIGTEVLDPDSRWCWLIFSPCRDSDAALYSATKPIRFGKIVRTADSSNCELCTPSIVVDGDLTITSTLSYVVDNETIHKIGQKSGWTYGIVNGTCVDAYNPFEKTTLCSDRIDFMVLDGDSGSPAFSVVSGTNVQLRGIVWGEDPETPPDFGDGWISNLGQIAIDLGDLKYYDPGAPSASISGPSEVPGQGIQCTWQSVVSYGIPPFTYSWSGLLSGSGGAVSGPIYSSGTLYLTVTDFWGRQAFASKNVTVEQGLPPLCE